MAKYTLYNDNGDIVMTGDDTALCDMGNWIYENEEGFIVDENGNDIEC